MRAPPPTVGPPSIPPIASVSSGSVAAPGGHHHHLHHHHPIPPPPQHHQGHQGHPGVMGHDRLNEYLELVRGEYEALQAECMVVKGQRDEFEKQSESSDEEKG